MTLVVDNVSVKFDARRVLDGFSLTIPTGTVVALTGRSGSGKSTLLKVIAGLIQPDTGTVCWDEIDLTHIPTHLRQVGMVFQDRVLFPHLDVGGNIAFGLRGTPKAEARQRVDQLLELIGLGGFGTRRVETLSGGEAQRVALARALAPRPRVLLLDEPLGALDLETRRQLTKDLAVLLRHEGTTALHVTHDPEEATQIADVVVRLPDTIAG
jgi:thiamine transport system ATP-binding protein